MAVAVTVTNLTSKRRVIRAVLTNQSSSSTETIDGFPRSGIIFRRTYVLSGGSASTIDPILHRDDVGKPTTGEADLVVEQPMASGTAYTGAGTPAQNVMSADEVSFYAPDRELYLTPQCNTGSDNSVVVEWEIQVTVQ